MAVQLKSTKDYAVNGVKMCVYSFAGAGKTSLIPTMPTPLVLSAESGLLSIKDSGVQYIDVSTMADLKEAYGWLIGSTEASHFESVALDSISEIAEVVLNDERKKSKDGRAAYGEMNTAMQELIRAFRDIPNKHVLMTAKLEKTTDEMGRMLYSPSMPGKTLTQGLDYYFDEVMALRVERDAEGIAQRALMCDSDGLWRAKDRSGKLSMWEAPHLGDIIKKIGGQ
jgi:hypothetical protein